MNRWVIYKLALTQVQNYDQRFPAGSKELPSSGGLSANVFVISPLPEKSCTMDGMFTRLKAALSGLEG